MKKPANPKINSVLWGGMLLVAAVLFAAQAPVACGVKTDASGQKTTVGQTCGGRTTTMANAENNPGPEIVKADAAAYTCCAKGEKALQAGQPLPACCTEKAKLTLNGDSR